MAHQMKNHCVFSVFHCVEGACGAASEGTPKMKNGALRDELKNGRGRGWAVAHSQRQGLTSEDVRGTSREVRGTSGEVLETSGEALSSKNNERKDKLFGPGDCWVGWGSSTRRGGGRKVRALPRKFVFLGFRGRESGMSQEFCRDVPDPWGCSKSLCKKSLCARIVPYSGCFSNPEGKKFHQNRGLVGGSLEIINLG